MVISFSNKRAFNYLNDHGYVFTYRENRRENSLESTWCNRGHGEKKEFDVNIIEVTKILDGIGLDKFGAMTGHIDEYRWKVAIREMTGGKLPREGWVYLVVKKQ